MTEVVRTKAVYTTDSQPPLYHVAGYETKEAEARLVESIETAEYGVTVKAGASALLIPWHRVARVEGILEDVDLTW